MCSSYVYLEPVFGSGTLQHEQALFKRIDKDFRFVMREIEMDPRVTSLTKINNITTIVNALETQLARCQQNLMSYITVSGLRNPTNSSSIIMHNPLRRINATPFPGSTFSAMMIYSSSSDRPARMRRSSSGTSVNCSPVATVSASARWALIQPHPPMSISTVLHPCTVLRAMSSS